MRGKGESRARETPRGQPGKQGYLPQLPLPPLTSRLGCWFPVSAAEFLPCSLFSALSLPKSQKLVGGQVKEK